MFKRILLIFILFFLFYLSSTSQILVSDPSTWLNGQHRDPTSDIHHIFNEDSVFFHTYFEDDKEFKDLGLEFYARKLLHISAYGFLALVFFWNLPRRWYRYPLALTLSISTSFLDEANQYATYGRSGRLWDVYLDSSAVLFALLALAFFRFFIKKRY